MKNKWVLIMLVGLLTTSWLFPFCRGHEWYHMGQYEFLLSREMKSGLIDFPRLILTDLLLCGVAFIMWVFART